MVFDNDGECWQDYLMSEQMFARQQSFDDLGTPLFNVTFVVLDIETTGTSAKECGITEVGAVKLRGGEYVGSFQTLVNPGTAIPPEITILTGIAQSMVMHAPRIEEVLPSLLEFVGGAVIVGHNLKFDLSFLNAALQRHGYSRLSNRTIDTLGLSRHLLRDEVPNCKLGKLADCLNLANKPNHRGLHDALTTADLLHFLIERAATLGVLGLEDLIMLPKLAGGPQAKKLNLTNDLPRSCGVYMFLGAKGEVIYVGKASNLRSRVRSYFSSDARKMVSSLLRETHAIEHQICGNELEASVLELRLIHKHLPRFNRKGKRPNKACYLKLALNERSPRLLVARKVLDDKALYFGPITSSARAKQAIEAIRCVYPIGRMATSNDAHHSNANEISSKLLDNLTRQPHEILELLRERILQFSDAQLFEQAAVLRDRTEALAEVLRRQASFDLLRRAGRVHFSIGDSWAEIRGGLLWRSSNEDVDFQTQAAYINDAGEGDRLPVPQPAQAEELLIVSAWIARHAHEISIGHTQGTLASKLPAIPSFSPKPFKC